VEHGRTGYLVADRRPDVFARHIGDILADPVLADRLSANAAERALNYTWGFAAARLRRTYADITSRDRVECR
jgi:D-inositol-3-phosphate glycosyltransferase